MLNVALAGLQKLSPTPKNLTGYVDDGMERLGEVHLVLGKMVIVLGGWQYFDGGDCAKGMQNDAWEISPLYPAGQHPANQYRIYTRLREKCKFPPRSDMACCVAADGTAYMTGGRLHPHRADTLLNDLWSSRDGVEWTLLCARCPWRPRHSHAMVPCANSDDVLLLAGRGGHIEGGWESFADVWRFSAADGTWDCVASQAEWTPRACATVRLGMRGEVVLCGGEVVQPREHPLGEEGDDGEPNELLNDVWRSTDSGASWQCATEEAPFPGARWPWLEHLPQCGRYVAFGRRTGVTGSESRVWASSDLVDWELLAEEHFDSRLTAKGTVPGTMDELRHCLKDQDGSLIFLTELLT